jgi:hypothetical protein
LKGPPALKEDHPFHTLVAKFSSMASMTQLGRTNATAANIARDNLDALTSYLGILAALSDDDVAEASGAATILNARLDERLGELNGVRRKELSGGAKEEVESVKKYVTALAKFADHIRGVYRQGKDAKEIKRLVSANKSVAKEYMSAVYPLLIAEHQIAETSTILSATPIRQAIRDEYRKANSPAIRLELLNGIAGYPLTYDANIQGKIKKLYSAAIASHDTLVGLIENPTEEDRKELRRQAFREFLNVASDAVGVIKFGL